MESAGYREKRILSVSAFMTSTTSWLRMKIKMQSLKTGVTSSITLTAASTMVFYSLDYSMSNFEQAKARIHRVSQTENCLYIYLTAKHTVDTKILRALRDKADLEKMLVDDYRNGSNPFQEGV